ncbi:CBP80/20-dependent translation initiation factor [Anthonomus grandis grandis]|uniref:CBP80/20-dependent translation initiation factor n=1 Tax=Anthonomus grandis grandis TaxID=2921223 RepID=UPI002165C657|nr:CBP80/20-dependent translation initiation factor [Anthonomus grandis grandis]
MSHLKRSQKTDFTANPPGVLMRERSFVKPSRDSLKRRSQTMATIKAGKPTMEIYRPPNVRTDLPNMSGKLNVHAKEFTMNELQASRSSGNIHLAMGFEPMPLQHSKSSGNILRHVSHHPGFIPILPAGMPLPLLHSASAAQLVGAMPRPNYQFAPELMAHPVFSGQNQHQIFHQGSYMPNNFHNAPQAPSSAASLKRSKSLGASDSQNLMTKLKSIVKEDIDINVFAEEDRDNIKQAIDDPNQLPSRTLMDLVKIIMEKAVEGIKYSESIAKLCVTIIEAEKNHTFLESLLNTCQQWYQERDKILRGIKAGDGTRFTAFMWFLTELYGLLKRQQIQEQVVETLQPELVLLSVLSKCCQACVSLPIKCLSETECLFFVLTSIGRDLESEIPQQLEQLLANVRDGFLANAGSASVRRTLLQLIELHASNWQLPGSSVLYYYPRIK